MKECRSNIRPSEIDSLLKKVKNKNYSKYITSIRLKNVRGFENEMIEFDFPVTALVGPNGGGKTTVLGAAGCAYKSIKPRRFFAKSGTLDDSMQGWEIEYNVVDKSEKPKGTVERRATFSESRWRRENLLQREVLVFGVSRTVPASENRAFSKYNKNEYKHAKDEMFDLSDSQREVIGRILGKNMDGYLYVSQDSAKTIQLLSAKTSSDLNYSEFHFGAGESSVIRMVLDMENAANNSLILIEEIENGLHPLATMRMVEYLIESAKKKNFQVIFTTHSNYALEPLPFEAIWSAAGGSLIQGKLNIESLRAITGIIDSKLVIFVEDNFAKLWVESIIRCMDKKYYDLIEVHAMSGDSAAHGVHLSRRKDPSIHNDSFCIVDGDSKVEGNHTERTYKLPGDAPELYVYEKVMEIFERVGGKLSVALLQDYGQHQEVKTTIEEAKISNRDHHVLYSQIGESLGLIPEDTVQRAFLTMWSQNYASEVEEIIEAIKTVLDEHV